MHLTVNAEGITWLTFLVPLIVGFGAGLGWFIASAVVNGVRARASKP